MKLKKLLKVINSNETINIVGASDFLQINIQPKDVKEEYLDSKIIMVTSFMAESRLGTYMSIIVDYDEEVKNNDTI